MTTPYLSCHLDGKTVRCECGGQVAVGATLHPLVDLGVGIVGGKPQVTVRHDMRRTIGFNGFCMKCHQEGNFFLPGHEPP